MIDWVIMRVVEGGVAQENLARGLRRRRHGLCRLLRRLHGRPGRRRPRPEEGPDVLFDGRGGQRVRLGVQEHWESPVL